MVEGPPQSLGFDATMPISSDATPVVSAGASAKPGARVDHFVLDRELGSGAMGTVYAAQDISLDRAVAIKFLRTELARDPDARKRFVQEAQAQARVRSAHVVQIFFIGQAGGRASLYFAMEQVQGSALDDGIDDGKRMDAETARGLMRQAAEGLRDAQRAGIVHRDIKPANLLLDASGTLKIADFGLAKPREQSVRLTRDGAVMGTPDYIAPEQALGEALDHRADMYGLGCAFYHLLSGKPPFQASTLVAMLAKHMSEAPTPLRQLAPDVPPRLAAIIARLMAKKRDERFATYDDLLSAIDAAAPARVEFAGFWARAAALGIDCIIGSALIATLGAIGLVVFIVYLSVAQGIFGRTLAKHLLRIEVQRLDGSRLGVPRAFARTVVALWLPFLVGLLIFWTSGVSGLRGSIVQLAAFEGAKALVVPFVVGNAVLTLLYVAGAALAAVHAEKRSLHDWLVGSRVVYRLAPHK